MNVSIPIFLSDDIVDTKVEIQIRTIAMDFWASLEHKIYYKFDGNAPDGIKDELRECANIITFLDQKMLSINESVQNYQDGSNENIIDTNATEINDDKNRTSNIKTNRMSEFLKSLFGSVSQD